ncbi:MAG: hypothetical protein ACJ74M_11700, partial [Gaiellaceae bacterium]
ERRSLAQTPFEVEFARKSWKRSCAPTLVPVSSDGAAVPAQLLVLDKAVSLKQAQDVLYRRESRSPPGVSYASSGATWIADAGPDDGLNHRLYTALPCNIRPSLELLAELAIKSAAERDDGLDGITYLRDMRQLGIDTPLTAAYEQEVLRRTKSATLEQAWAQARGRT